MTVQSQRGTRKPPNSALLTDEPFGSRQNAKAFGRLFHPPYRGLPNIRDLALEHPWLQAGPQRVVYRCALLGESYKL